MSRHSSGPSSAIRRVLVASQIFLVTAALFAPLPAAAVDPTEEPGTSASPSAEPVATPAPDPSPDPTSEPTPEPTPEPPAPTPEPTIEPTEPTAEPTADSTPEPSAEPSVEPTAEPAPESTPASTAPATTRAYVVSFVAGTTPAEQTVAVIASGATTTDTIGILRIHAVNASDAAATLLRTDPLVSTVELDRSRAVEATPDDPSYGGQWALPQIGWDQAFGVTEPAGSAVVAVLDTGVDASHPDLDDNIVTGSSFVAGSSWSTDANGHGTAMAGIVAAETNNGAGIAGVGYAGVAVMPVTVLGPDGLGRDSDIIEGVVWAADHGADVILMSFSATGYSSALQAAVDYAWSAGVVLVAAAGNDGSSINTFPAGDAGVVGVSATDQSDALAGFSNSGESVFLGAPGVDIAMLGGSVSGTSASAAIVAGSAGLIAAADPSASNGTIVGRLARNADAAGSAAQTGNGRLNLARALADNSTEAVKPAGAHPADGGPFVGPYVAAAPVPAFDIAPSHVSAIGPHVFTALVRNTVGDNNDRARCVRVTLPSGFTAISAQVTAGGGTGTWASSAGANFVQARNGESGNTGAGLDSDTPASNWIRFEITATAGVSTNGVTGIWTARAQQAGNSDCASGGGTYQLGVSVATTLERKYSADFRDGAGIAIPQPIAVGPQTYSMRITHKGSGAVIPYAVIAVPTCLTGLTLGAVSDSGPVAPDNSDPSFTASLSDNLIRLQGSSPLKLNHWVQIEFTATAAVSCTAAMQVFRTAAWANSSPQTGVGDIYMLDAPAATLAIDDVTSAEGTTPAGTTPFTFTVTRSSTTGTSTVNYATGGGTATGGAACAGATDYVTTTGTLTFLAGEATKTVTVNVCRDAIYELNETFNVTLSAATNATITDGTGVGTITNDDAAPTLSINDVSMAEGTGGGSTTLVFTVTKSGATDVASTVQYATASGTAVGGATCATGIDFVDASGSLGFLATDATQTISVTICRDAVYELAESFEVNLSSPDHATILDGQGIGTINNDDAQPAFSINDVTLAEGTTPAGSTAFVFTVTKLGATELNASVDYATANGSATGGVACGAGIDFETKSGTLTFVPAVTSQTIAVNVCRDAVFELNEMFNVNLSGATNAMISDGTGVGTITNDDTIPSLSINDVSANEGTSATPTTFTFTVTKNGDSEIPVVVSYATGGGTASAGLACGAGVDYVATSGLLTFAPGDSTKAIDVSVCADAVFEVDQTFNVALSLPSFATISDGMGLGTIVNDDTAPTFSINDVSDAEGTASPTTRTFTVTKTGQTELTSTVTFGTTNGTAVGGASCLPAVDYITTSGSLTFAAGETSKPIVVGVCNDATFENDETFFVNLAGPTNATITDNQGVGGIQNDDAAPVISIGNSTVSEGNGTGTTSFLFLVTKTGATELPATVDWATSAGTATAGTSCTAGIDFITDSDSLTFAPGEISKTITVLVCQDSVYELDETFTIVLTTPVNATLGDDTGLGTIENDDAAPVLFIIDVSQAEGDSGTTSFTFNVGKAGATAVTATVDFDTLFDTAIGGAACADSIDYEDADGTLSFAPADTSKTIEIAVCGDAVYEFDDEFFVNLSAPTHATIADGTGTGTITNDDAPPTLAIDDVIADEGDGPGTTSFTFTVTRTGATEVPASVNWATAADTATAGSSCSGADYISGSGSLTFAPDDLSETITVAVCGELVFEANQTFFVDLSGASHATVTDGQGQGTIVNDDDPPVLTIDDVSAAEGDSGTTAFTFTVTKTGDTELEATVAFATGGGSATAGTCLSGADYVATNGTLTFAPADTSETIDVTVCGDTVYELDQTFNVNLSGATNATVAAGDTGTGTGTIVNDDAAPVLTINDVSANEGDGPATTSFTFTVTKTGATEAPATVNWATAPGTATAGSSCPGADYISGSGSLTFAPDDPSETITVEVCGDNLAEVDETFFVNLSDPSHASVTDGQGQGGIVNEDAAPVVDAGGPYNGLEGSWIQLSGTATDADDSSLTQEWTYEPVSGVDDGASCEFDDANYLEPQFRCTDDGTYRVKLAASDGTNSGSDTADVVLLNENPDISINSPAFGAQYAIPATVALAAPFTDAGANDVHTCVIDWDEPPQPPQVFAANETSGNGDCNASHTYTAPGVYTITVTVTDDDGGSDAASVMIIVYDPNGGFVTGGGWIVSPALAYTPEDDTDPDVTGRANFGFVAKYRKGLAEGQTEFQFKAGDLNFHSEAYSSLVVSGFKAQFRGTGTVNGATGYKFTLTAYDGQANGGGGTDKFRIRITKIATGVVLYDNKFGSTEDIDGASPMAISGGSIVIHK